VPRTAPKREVEMKRDEKRRDKGREKERKRGIHTMMDR